MRATGLAALRLAGIVGLLLTLTPLVPVSGQSIIKLSGVVVDSLDGRAIPHAVISIPSTTYLAEADIDGRFSIPFLPSGEYSVVARAPGYREKRVNDVIIVDDIPTGLRLCLEPVVHLVDSIIVVGDHERDAWDNTTVLTREIIDQRHPRDLSDLLESVEGVQINRTGGTGGQALISIRGSSPEHVLVLIDGQKANAAANGVVDLSTIPIEMVERVEIHRGGASARYGSEAMAGVINIITQPKSTTPAMNVGSASETGKWGSRRFSAQLSDIAPLARLNTRLSASTLRSDGNFGYTYTVQPSNKVYSGTRANNAVESQNYFISARYDYSSESQLSFSTQWYDNTTDLPGSASAPTPDARKTDNRRMLNVQWMRGITPSMSIQSQAAFSRYMQSFVDTTNSSPLYRYYSDYQSDAYSLESNVSGRVGGTSGQLGIQFQRDEFSQKDIQRPAYSMGDSRRDVVAAYASVAHRVDISRMRVLKWVSFDFALRADHSKTHKDSTSLLDMTHAHSVTAFSPKVGIALRQAGSLSYGLHANYGRSFRLPPINALFWKGDAYTRGNPGLRPERAEHSEAGAEIQYSLGILSARVSSTYFHRYVSDLIVWAQGQGGAWQPYNLAAAQLTGHEDAVSVSLWNRALVVQYANTITTSRNRAPGHVTYDKELTFTPHYIQSLSLRSDIDVLYGGLILRSVGRRYALDNNQKYYDGYSVVDVNAGARVAISHFWRVELGYELKNVSDEDYVLIAHYPMPGREWHVGFGIEFGSAR